MRILFLFLSWFLLHPEVFAERLRIEVTADTGISSERGHFDDNSGRSVTVPIRQNQNWARFETKAYLFRFDKALLTGTSVEKAWLNIFLARGNLFGIGICTVLSDWEEGRGVNGQTGRGGASWNWAAEPPERDKPARGSQWSWPGSGIYSVSWAHPDLIYQHVDGREIGKEEIAGGVRHLRFPLDPRLVAAVVRGIAGGLVLTDDKGQVAEGLSLKGQGTPYIYNHTQDIYIFTREIQDPSLRPFLEVETAAVENTPPGVLGNPTVVGSNPFNQSVTVSFAAPADDGDSGGPVLGYEVRYGLGPISEEQWEESPRLPLWSLPRPADPGVEQDMTVMGLEPGSWYLTMRAMDHAGNLGAPVFLPITVPAEPEVSIELPPEVSRPAGSGGVLHEGKMELWAVCDLTKVDPVSGWVQQDGDNYEDLDWVRTSNPVWSAAERKVSLRAARGEVVAFKLIIGRTGDGKLSGIELSASDLGSTHGLIKAGENISVYRVWYLDVAPRQEEQIGPWELVQDQDHRPAWHGDACLPLAPPFDSNFDLPTMDNLGGYQRYQAVWVDVFVPPETAPGEYSGALQVNAGVLSRPAEVTLEVEVLPIDLPQRVTWTVELNAYAYGLTRLMGVDIAGEPKRFLKIERRLHQLAHQHRGTLNILPYNQDGSVQPRSAPPLSGSGADMEVSSWEEWDSRYADYLSGRAFTVGAGYWGPGEGMPVEHMYLPFHENWPAPIRRHYQDWAELRTREQYTEWARTSRPLEEAFDAEYRQANIAVARQFFEHFRRREFTGTSFQTYYNNKYYFKCSFFGTPDGGRGSSFWLLDEPVDYEDYAANRFFLGLIKTGYDEARAAEVKAHFRTDVSQPEMARGLWDGICNLWNNSTLYDFGTTARYRMRRIPGEEYWSYGGGPGIADRHVQMQVRFFNHWAIGSSGELPYWDSLRGDGWFRPSNLAIFYPGTDYARSGLDYDGALAGVRLKVIRRAQQDIEYLNLLAARDGWSRDAVRKALACWADDPTSETLSFKRMTVGKLFRIRQALAAEIMGG